VGAALEDVALTGGQADPAARHEGRYCVAGPSARRVREGRAEASVPVGDNVLANHIAFRPRCTTSIRLSWLGSSFGAIIIVALTLVVWALRIPEHPHSQSPDELFLSWLHDARLAEQFDSDASALAHGKQVCRTLGDGGPKRGSAADKFAVDLFCPQFVDGFYVIETATVRGTFVLTDEGLNAGSIASDGESCHGGNGYADINRNANVIVRNGETEILDITSLGDGRGDNRTCTFSFSFSIPDGQDRYVVSVSHRGDYIYSFDQLTSQGFHVRLGG
jgi:hypothetical protein